MSKKHKITLVDLVMWKLNRITIGDIVRPNADKKRRGIIVGMSVPMSHTGLKDIDVESFERTDYVVRFETVIRGFKRWEIERV